MSKVNPHQLKVFEEGTQSPTQTSILTRSIVRTMRRTNTSRSQMKMSNFHPKMASFTALIRRVSPLNSKKNNQPTMSI